MAGKDKINAVILSFPYILSFFWDRNKIKSILKDILNQIDRSVFVYREIKNNYVLIETRNIDKDRLPDRIEYRNLHFKESPYDSSRVFEKLEGFSLFPFYGPEKSIGFVGTKRDGLKEEDILLFYFISFLYELIDFQERVEEVVIKDDLTELNNSKFFLVSLRKILSDEKNYPVTVIFMDLDNFKEINDVHGHFVGGKVLQKVGEFLKKFFMSTDYSYAVISRYGGDEFAFLLPKTELEEGVIIANTIREEMEEYEIKVKDDLCFKIMASFGVASFPISTDKPEKLLVLADRALFEAKKMGKNRVYSIPPLEK